MLQIKKVLKVKDADGEFMDLPVLTGAPGQKGDKGDAGAKGDAGSDANVTAQNIASALGYTPIGTETDPTVPDWAKAESKPTYQANEIAMGDSTVGAVLSQHSTEIAELQTDKQDKLTAGTNITIVDNVISASGGGDDTKAVMTSTTDPAWSATEQANARKRIGASGGKFELIETITLTEDAKTISRSADPEGNAYNFKKVAIYCNISSDAQGKFGCDISDGTRTVTTINVGTVTTAVKSYAIIMDVSEGFLQAYSVPTPSDGYNSGYAIIPYRIAYNGFITMDKISSVVISHYNGKFFLSGGVFKIYGIRA